jgi:membrane carboxypeptidase/penicillin-binding protein PbpC
MPWRPGEEVQIAIVVADHASGEILASVGSAGLTDDRGRALST